MQRQALWQTFQLRRQQDVESKLSLTEDKGSFVNYFNGSKTGPLYTKLCSTFDKSGCFLMLPIISAVMY